MRRVAANVIALDDQRIATKNLAPGQRVYDEDLLTIDGAEWRTWDPTRSKLGAYLIKGGRHFPLDEKSRVVYLGAANGTTPSHVSDVVSQGLLVAVEFSPRSFRDLLRMSSPRQNVVPVLADAWRPELYERYVGRVDLLFQDIAQRQQAQIFVKNLERFRPPWGIISVKARSVNVAAHPRDVYDQVARDITELSGYEVVEVVDLGPFEKDHAAIVVRPAAKGGAKPAPQQAERRDERPPPREHRRDDRPPRRDDRPPPRKDWQNKGPRGPPREGGYEKRGPPREGGFKPGRPDRRGWR
jgi:fibrillarin-like pre-rRNA processing protein